MLDFGKSRFSIIDAIKLFIIIYFFSITFYYFITCIKVGQNVLNIILTLVCSVFIVHMLQQLITFDIKKIHFLLKVIFLFLLCFIPRFILILNNKFDPVSDYGYYYYSALRFARRSVFEPGRYMLILAPHTLGFVSYIGIILKWFGEGVYIPLLLNCIYSSLTVVLIYAISIQLMDDNYAFLSGFIYALSLSTFFYSINIASEPLPLFLSLLGVLLYIYSLKSANEHNKIIKLALSAVTIGIAYTIRASSVLFFIGILIYEVFYNHDKFKFKRLVCVLILFITLYCLYALYKHHIFQRKMPPALGWPLFEGLDLKTYGTWSVNNYNILFNLIDTNPTETIQPTLLKMAINKFVNYSLLEKIDLFLGKGVRTWIYNTYTSYILREHNSNWNIEFINIALNSTYRILLFSYIYSSAISFFISDNSTKNKLQLILLIPILFTILAHSVISSIDRYHYCVIPLIIILFVYNISLLSSHNSKTDVLLKTKGFLQ